MKNRDSFSIQVNKVIVGLSMAPTDEALLGYLDFLKEVLPIRSITAVHVIPKSSLIAPVPVIEFRFAKMLEDFNRERRRKVWEEIKECVNEQLSGPRALKVEYRVLEGSPLEMLLEIAEAGRVDLLIIGKKAAKGPHEILAKNLVRHARGPTLIIPEKARTRMRRVLVPVDFSDNSLRALTTALALKETIGRPIEVQAIHIYQRPGALPDKIHMMPDRFEENIRESHQKSFNSFLKDELAIHAEKVRPVVEESHPPGIAQQIRAYIRKNDIDLVIMGAKGHSKLRVLLLGSVLESFLDLNEEVPTWVVN